MTYRSIEEWVSMAVNAQRHIEVTSSSEIDIAKAVSDFRSELKDFKPFEIEQSFTQYIRIWPFMPRPKDIRILCEIERLKEVFTVENAERALLDEARNQKAH